MRMTRPTVLRFGIGSLALAGFVWMGSTLSGREDLWWLAIALMTLGSLVLWRGTMCPQCRHSGFVEAVRRQPLSRLVEVIVTLDLAQCDRCSKAEREAGARRGEQLGNK